MPVHSAAVDERFVSLKKSLSENLRKRRLAKGFSQEALALSADVDRTYVSQIERGVGNPSLLVLFKLALILDAEVGQLLTPIETLQRK
jgi:transcriptional regulator with XRE-family HTH domain